MPTGHTLDGAKIARLKLGIRRVQPPIPLGKYPWARIRANPHRHQRMVSRLIRSLRERLCLTQIQLGALIGVRGITIYRWERVDGARPWPRHFHRIRALWHLSRHAQTDEFWRDRVSPPRFYE